MADLWWISLCRYLFIAAQNGVLAESVLRTSPLESFTCTYRIGLDFFCFVFTNQARCKRAILLEFTCARSYCSLIRLTLDFDICKLPDTGLCSLEKASSREPRKSIHRLQPLDTHRLLIMSHDIFKKRKFNTCPPEPMMFLHVKYPCTYSHVFRTQIPTPIRPKLCNAC